MQQRKNQLEKLQNNINPLIPAISEKKDAKDNLPSTENIKQPGLKKDFSTPWMPEDAYDARLPLSIASWYWERHERFGLPNRYPYDENYRFNRYCLIPYEKSFFWDIEF